MDMDALRVDRGFAEDERSVLGALYWAAFRGKLRAAFAADHTGLDIVRRALRPENVLVARCGTDVVGLCGFHADGAGAVDLTWRGLRATLSLPGAVRATACLALLERSSATDALVLDGVCVDERVRGLGIGSLLLDAAEREADRRGVGAVQLTVVDTNPRARRLYASRGYRPVDAGRLGILSVVYGFDGYTVMQKEVG